MPEGHQRFRFIRLIAMLCVLALVAVACGDDDDDDAAGGQDAETTTTAAAEEGCDATVPGSQVNFGVFAPSAAIDPPNSSGALVGGTELINVYDTLMRWDPKTGTFVPKVAQSLTPNADFTEWTLKLRPNMTFADGTPFDAANVDASIQRFFGQGLRNNASGYLSLITERQVVDPTTLVFKLSQPWATFGFALADEPGEIVNVKAIGADVAAFGLNPPAHAGIGPYTVERHVPNEELVLKARSDYWGGPVCIERLRFVFVPGSRATYDAFKAGDLDVAFLREADVIADAKEADENSIFAVQDAGNMIMINHRADRPGSNPDVREAIVKALDEEVINERIYAGEAKVMRQVIHPDSRLYSDAVEEAPKDAAGAKAALERAKAAGFDGNVEILCTDRPPGPDLCITVKASLDAAGFTTTTVLLPQNDQILRVAQTQFDISQFGFNVSASTAFAQLYINLHSKSPRNRMGYSSPALDAALSELAAAEDLAEQKEAIAALNNAFVEDNAAFSFNAAEEGIVFTDAVKGIRETVATTFFFDKAYLEE